MNLPLLCTISTKIIKNEKNINTDNNPGIFL